MAKAAEKPAVFEVVIPFTTEIDGAEVVFRKGEPVEGEHPVLRRVPADYFRPFAFPHPIRRTQIEAPEVRAD